MEHPGKKKTNVTEARPRRTRPSRGSDGSEESGSSRQFVVTDHVDGGLSVQDSFSKHRRQQPPLRTESGDSRFIGDLETDQSTRNSRPVQKTNVVESRRSRQRRTSGNYRQSLEISSTQPDGGIGLVPMDAMGTLKTVHSRYSGVSGDDFLKLDQNIQEGGLSLKKPPLGQVIIGKSNGTGRHEEDSTSTPGHNESFTSSDDAISQTKVVKSHEKDESRTEPGCALGSTEDTISRPTATGHVHKPRPVSHRKHHAKPVPPPAGPRRNSPNRAPGDAPGGGANKSKKDGGPPARGLASSKSFLGASLFNMSFLLAKPPSALSVGQDAEAHEDKSLATANSRLDTERYPTNESALPRMASFYGANKASLNPVVALNTHLHPAAAGASFILPSRPRAPTLSPSDRYRQNDLSRALSMQYSSIEEYGQEFPPDCGPTLDDKILSYQYAMRVAAFNHAGQIDSDGINFIQHPLNSDFGWFALPFQSLLGSDTPESGVLEKYGIGMTLWFKFLKAFGIIFLVMFLVTFPSLIFFVNGTQYSGSERSFFLQNSPTDLFFTTTLGNIAQTGTMCYPVGSNEEVVLDCGQSTIASISIQYGHPTGSCHCPSVQQPLRSGSCPGEVKRNSGKEECSRDMYGKPEACYYSELVTFYATPQPCCAYSKDQGQPDLSDLKIKPDYSCNSLTAQYIAEGLCLGKSSCVLISNSRHPYSWIHTGAELPSNVCSSTRSIDDDSHQCNTTLGYMGSWDSCPNSIDDDRYMLVEAACSVDDVVVFGSPVSRDNVVIISSILNAFAVAIFIFGIYWVALQQRMEEVYMDRNTCRAKDFTVRLDVIPEHNSTHVLAKNLKRHFEKTLSECKPCYLPGVVRVADINFTTGGYGVLEAAIKRGKAARQLDVLLYKKKNMEMLQRQSTWAYKLVVIRENRAKEAYEKWNEICIRKAEEGNSALKVKRSYVTFESEEGYLRCLKYYQPHAFAAFFNREDFQLEGKRLKVHPAEDPSDILWENLGTPRSQQILGRLFTLFLLLALLVATYFVVDNAIRAGHSYEDDFPHVVNCEDFDISLDKKDNSTLASVITYQRTLRDVKWQYYNNSEGRQGYLQCYCKEVFKERGLNSMIKYKFYDESQDRHEKWCEDVVFRFVNLALVRLVLAVVVVAVNISAKSILRALKDFERRNSHTEISESMTFKLFVVQVVNTGLLVLVMNAKVAGFDQTSISFLNGKYADFTAPWYADVGISIMFTMMLYMFGVHGLKLVTIVSSKFFRWQDKHFTSDTRLTNQVSQEQLNKLYLGPEFVIEVRYATALTICFVCVTYAPAMPLMYLITAVAFWLLYIVDKFYFLRVSRIPRAVSPSLAHSVVKSFYVAAFFNLAIAIWSFSNSVLFAPKFDKVHNIEEYNGLEFVNVEFKYNSFASLRHRLFNKWTIASWIVLFPLSIMMVYIFSEDIIRRLLYIIEQTWPIFGMNIAERVYEGNPEYFDSIPLSLLKRRVDDGIAKKHIFDRYKKRIKELESGSVAARQLEGLESYDISLNEIYADKLAINTDYIALKRPPDLFKDDTCMHDEEKGRDQNSPHKDLHKQSDSKSGARRSQDVETAAKSRNRTSPASERTASRRSSSSPRSPRERNGAGWETKNGTSGSSRQSRKEKNQLVTGQNSASFASLYPDEVEEVRDVTELFF